MCYMKSPDFICRMFSRDSVPVNISCKINPFLSASNARMNTKISVSIREFVAKIQPAFLSASNVLNCSADAGGKTTPHCFHNKTP